MSSMSAKFELDKFDEKGDFGFWKKKMKALLVQQKVSKALDAPSKLPTSMSDAEKAEMAKIAYSTVILYLADNVLRRVSAIDNVSDLWTKLDELFLSKSLANKIYLKERLFDFKMDSSKGLEENIDDFCRICLDLVNASEKLDGENQVVILLNSLPDKYKEVKSDIRYECDKLTFDIVFDALQRRS